MPPLEAFAYPALLLAIYGIYRAGGAVRSRASPFEWVRTAALAVFTLLCGLLQYRLIASGETTGLFAIVSAGTSVAAMVGLLGLHALRLAERPAA